MCWEEDKEEELAAKYRAACLAAVKAAQESVRAPNFVHSCCFDSMAASSEQPKHRIADNERTAAEAARSVTTYRDPHRSKHSAGRPRSSSMPLIRGHKNGCGSISDPTYHLTSKAMPFPTGSWNTQLIIPAQSCSLCGKTGHFFDQCPDNVDPHTSDSEDKMTPTLKAPRNL